VPRDRRAHERFRDQLLRRARVALDGDRVIAEAYEEAAAVGLLLRVRGTGGEHQCADQKS
jgi:hypothetical protein